MQIDYETERELGIDYETLAVKVADKVLEMEKCPYDAQVNLVLTDNEEIERVNTEFRDIARPTDVLSFPMIPFETPAGYDIVEEDESYFDLDTDELLLGDIMISVDKVFAQAEEYGHSVTREFCFLVAHSMLHLLGYDHMVDEERIVMEQKQNEVYAAITLALHEYQGYTMHVPESGILTLGNADTEWNSKLRTQRQLPEHKF